MATRKSLRPTEKKTTTRQAPTKKAAAASTVQQAANQVATQVIEKHNPSYHEIAQLAEQFWIERGRPFGSPEVDWLRAESTLHA